jgi:hypothetical protein
VESFEEDYGSDTSDVEVVEELIESVSYTLPLIFDDQDAGVPGSEFGIETPDEDAITSDDLPTPDQRARASFVLLE